MKSFGSIFAIIMLFITVFYSMNIIGITSLATGDLDDQSKSMVVDLNSNLQTNYNLSTDFSSAQSNLTDGNATFDGQDVFAQEFLEGKSSALEQAGFIETIWSIPDTLIISLGVNQQDVALYKSIILLIIGAIVSFATFRAFFGGGRVTDN